MELTKLLYNVLGDIEIEADTALDLSDSLYTIQRLARTAMKEYERQIYDRKEIKPMTCPYCGAQLHE